MKYLSTFEVAEKWGISPRRVGILCNNDRIPGAQRAGSRWIIPEDAEKPTDDNALSVNINRIREKLAGIGLTDFIKTKHRQGYTI